MKSNLAVQNSSVRKPQRKRRSISLDSDDEEFGTFIEEINGRKEENEKYLKVEEKRL